MSEALKKIREGVIDGNRELVVSNIQSALDEGVAAQEILNEGLISAMNEVGRLFEEGEFFVPEMLIAARAMQAGLALLKPYLLEQDVKPLGVVVAGTVKGDLHDIGKNLVCMMLEGAGFTIRDLGSDVSAEKFVEAVSSGDVDIVAMSALLTTTMPSMKSTIEALATAGLRDKVKVMVGGAPFTDNYAKQIGADGFSPDASRAVALAKSLIEA